MKSRKPEHHKNYQKNPPLNKITRLPLKRNLPW